MLLSTMSTTASSRAVYRHLLRCSSYAVRHSRPAVKNVRRMLRDDIEAHLDTPESTAANTLLLYLAASNRQINNSSQSSQRKNTPSSPLLHRMISNLSTLCYHHLSPNTMMQPNIRSRRIGGTDSPASRRLRSRRASAKIGADERGSRSEEVLLSLSVPSKRVRGPLIGSVNARTLRAKRWDGQKHDNSIALTPAKLAELEARVHDASQMVEKNKTDPFGKPPADLLKKFKDERGVLRSKTREWKLQQDALADRQASKSLLVDLVTRTQSSLNAWIGAARFQKAGRNEWLPP